MYAFPYLSQTTFLKCPAVGLLTTATKSERGSHSAPPFAVCGIAWDGCVTNRPGARFGPGAIRQASHLLCDGIHPDFDVTPHDPMGAKFSTTKVPHSHNDRLTLDEKERKEGNLEGTRHCPLLVDYGDLELPNTSLDGMRAAMVAPIETLLRQGGHESVLFLGGDHSITLPILRAYHNLWTLQGWRPRTGAFAGGEEKQQPAGQKLAVLHFDAHCDTWTDHFGEPSGHGTWVSEAISEELVDPKSFVQIGIRSSADKEAREYVTDQGGLIFTARNLRGVDGPTQMRPALITPILERWEAQGNPPVYITLDIDSLDPAFAPGTGTPEPGGLSTSQVLTVLEEILLAGVNVVGMDLVEVAPAYDHAELTSNAAATLAWTYLCGAVWQRKQREQT